MDREDGYIPNHLITDSSRGTTESGSLAPLEIGSDDSMFGDSETSFHSMSTIQSDELADYFLSVYGLRYESGESVPRLFPSDYSQDRRDIMLHLIFRFARGGKNVPPIVDEMLQSHGMEGRQGALRVLEVVTNSGAWVQEMAETYPSATFVSIDTKPLVAHKPHARISYQVYDLCAGIMEPDCSFDVVYTKSTVVVTKDLNRLLRDMLRVLKPNGFLLIDMFPISAYEGEYPGVLFHSSSLLAEGFRFLNTVWERLGSEISAWDDLASRLDPAHPHWQDSQSVASDTPGRVTSLTRGFHSIDLEIGIVPIGAWSTDERGKVLGGLMRLFTGVVWRSSLPAMLMSGTDQTEAQTIITNFSRGLENVERYRAYHKCQLWCARRL